MAEWEAWTGIAFPGSGQHVVPGALQPVMIDRARDVGRYEDPNVWMRHSVAAGAAAAAGAAGAAGEVMLQGGE